MLKTLKNLLLQKQKSYDPYNLACIIGDSSSTKFFINDDPKLTLTYFKARLSWVICTFERVNLLQNNLIEEKLQQRTILSE